MEETKKTEGKMISKNQDFRSAPLPSSSPSPNSQKEDDLIPFLEGSWAPPPQTGKLFEEAPSEAPKISPEKETDQQGMFFSEDDSATEPKEEDVVKKSTKASISPIIIGQEQPSSVEQEVESLPTSFHFKDGLFSAIGTYETEKGEESIGVKVRLQSGLIEELEIIPLAGNKENEEEQETFAGQISKIFTRERIDQLPEISGYGNSSKILDGFQKAILLIIEKAEIVDEKKE